jgi:hypothetical protein
MRVSECARVCVYVCVCERERKCVHENEWVCKQVALMCKCIACTRTQGCYQIHRAQIDRCADPGGAVLWRAGHHRWK